MTHEVSVTTEDQDTTVTPDPAVPGRYTIEKTTVLTTTVKATTVIDVVQVADAPARPPVVFGWNADGGTTDGLQKMIDTYGPPDVCRVFTSPGKGIIAWNNPLLAMLPDDCVLLYSFKDWPLPSGAFANFMTGKPTNRFPEVWWCIDHEPEQGPTQGDPDPATYRRQWSEALAIHQAHPRRDEFPPLPVFTEYYARKYDTTPNPSTGKTWYEDFGVVLEMPGIKGAGWDIYDTTYSDYRTPEHRNAIPLKYSEAAGLPILIAEWGIAEKTAVDPDGSRSAQAIRDNVAYLRDTVTHPVLYVTWFHTGGDSLYDRPKSLAAYKEALAANPA